jgi:dTDP-4-dehydrorhamnose 3,5-epimerase
MRFTKNQQTTEITDVLTGQYDYFSDLRGQIWTIHSEDNGLTKFVEDKITVSNKNVLRGLHGDGAADKLISCLYGTIQLAVVDARKNSPTRGVVETFILSDKEPRYVFVPAGCLNGHLCLSDRCIFWYKWSQKYTGAETQETVLWKDEDLKIPWICKDPMLSDRDKNGNSFKEVEI